jgi:hypothetical protein
LVNEALSNRQQIAAPVGETDDQNGTWNSHTCGCSMLAIIFMTQREEQM